MTAAAAAQPIGVSVSGISLRCFWHGDAPPWLGMPVTLAFRSERVSLRPSNASERNGPGHEPIRGHCRGMRLSWKFSGLLGRRSEPFACTRWGPAMRRSSQVTASSSALRQKIASSSAVTTPRAGARLKQKMRRKCQEKARNGGCHEKLIAKLIMALVFAVSAQVLPAAAEPQALQEADAAHKEALRALISKRKRKVA